MQKNATFAHRGSCFRIRQYAWHVVTARTFIDCTAYLQGTLWLPISRALSTAGYGSERACTGLVCLTFPFVFAILAPDRGIYRRAKEISWCRSIGSPPSLPPARRNSCVGLIYNVPVDGGGKHEKLADLARLLFSVEYRLSDLYLRL